MCARARALLPTDPDPEAERRDFCIVIQGQPARSLCSYQSSDDEIWIISRYRFVSPDSSPSLHGAGAQTIGSSSKCCCQLFSFDTSKERRCCNIRGGSGEGHLLLHCKILKQNILQFHARHAPGLRGVVNVTMPDSPQSSQFCHLVWHQFSAESWAWHHTWLQHSRATEPLCDGLQPPPR